MQDRRDGFPREEIMRIIISPAKNMQVETDLFEVSGTPAFLERAEHIRDILKEFDREELKALYQANDKITELNWQRLRHMDLREGLTPAVLAYVGLQYQSMAPRVFTDSQWDYVRDHLYILSGFYGILRAMDGVVPYRLEMQAKLSVDGSRDLYGYWGDAVYRELTDGEDHPLIVNLASKEYSRAVEPWLRPGDRFVTCVFGEEGTDRNGRPKVKVKATQAKMARGSMVRYLAEIRGETEEDLKGFQEEGFRFREDLSGDGELVFIRKPEDRT